MDGQRNGSGRRAADSVRHLQALTVELGKIERSHDVLSCEVQRLRIENNELRRTIAQQAVELAALRMLRADVLTAAIEAGYDGKL